MYNIMEYNGMDIFYLIKKIYVQLRTAAIFLFTKKKAKRKSISNKMYVHTCGENRNNNYARKFTLHINSLIGGSSRSSQVVLPVCMHYNRLPLYLLAFYM